jgi:hypothetical protein
MKTIQKSQSYTRLLEIFCTYKSCLIFHQDLFRLDKATDFLYNIIYKLTKGEIKMTKLFKVYISETVISETIIEAEDVRDAAEKVWEVENDWTEIDWCNSRVEDILEVEE